MQNINFEDIPEPKDFDFSIGTSEYHAKWDGKEYEVTWEDMQRSVPVKYKKEEADERIKKGLWEVAATYTKRNNDPINQPSHYHQNGIDVIGFSEAQFSKDELRGFYRINCLKYITRFDRKGGVEDIKKASFYLNKLLEMEESK